MRVRTSGWERLHSDWWIYILAYFFPLIYIKCEWLLNRVEGLVQELGNSPFLKTQWNRGRTAYVGIWMVNRWITQSNVFLCRLAGIVLWYLYMCEGECEMGAWRSGDSSFPIVLRSGQKYLQCQEVFWKIFEKNSIPCWPFAGHLQRDSLCI